MAKREIKRLARDKRGAVAVEYAMVLVAVVVPSVTAIMFQGNYMYNQYKTVRSEIVLPIP